MIKKIVIFSFIVSLFLFSFISNVLAKYYSMTLHYDKGKISVVENSLKFKSGNARAMRKPHVALNNRIYECQVVDSREKVLYSVYLKIPRVLYGDWLDENGNLTGVAIPLEETDFFVRVPYVDWAASLRIVSSPAGEKMDPQIEGKQKELLIDIQDFSDVSKSDEVHIEHVIDRCRIIVLGEGYTASQKKDFYDNDTLINSHFEQMKIAFENNPPFSDLNGYIEYIPVPLESTDSGADHPSHGIYVDTALDASYGMPPYTRLLTVDYYKAIDEAASNVPYFDPDSDFVFVIVNDPKYGGTGGTFAVSSVYDLGSGGSGGIMLHEAGHYIAGLADENESAYPYPAGAWEPNVTFACCCGDDTDPCCDINSSKCFTRDNIKWGTPSDVRYPEYFQPQQAGWHPGIDLSTPLPTPDHMVNSIGLFEGARYLPSDIYRPKHTCRMRSVNQPFCEVCQEEIVLTIKQIATYNSPPTPPSITFTPNELYCEDTVRIQAHSTDPEGDTITYEWEVIGGPILWEGDPGEDTYFGPMTEACNYTFYCTARDEHGEPSITNSKVLNINNPGITSIEKLHPLTAFKLKISGDGFGSGTGKVFFGNFQDGIRRQATFIPHWTNDEINVRIPFLPLGTNPCNLDVQVVTSDNCESNVVTYTGPLCIILSQSFGLPGAEIYIYGDGFGTDKNKATVTFNGVVAKILSIYDTEISVEVPGGATGNVLVTIVDNGRVYTSNGAEFIVGVSAGDVYPREALPAVSNCGDGVIDIFDLLEEIDHVLGLYEMLDCPLDRADVPTGTPPDCTPPDNSIDIFDILVIINAALGRFSCIDYYYGIIYRTMNTYYPSYDYSPSYTLTEGSVTITAENDSGYRGSHNNPVKIYLDNPDDKARGVQMDICDEDDYLTVTGCETTDRTSGFSCEANNLPNDCSRVLLYSSNNLIEKGTGPVITITYDVSEEAPGGECSVLNIENVKVRSDNNSHPVDTASVPGQFCFDNCTTSNNCDHGLWCYDNATCVNGACQDTNKCQDDGAFCNGVEYCDEDNDECKNTEEPCAGCYSYSCTCDEDDHLCVGCDADDDCDYRCNPGESAPNCTGVDNCPDNLNNYQIDADGDGIGDVCDNCTDNDGDGYGDPYYPQNTCTLDDCPYDSENDTDNDGICGNIDNCPETSNGPDNGTCVKEGSLVVLGTGVMCTDNSTCGSGETCDMEQGDINENGAGDACECYADFNDNGRIDGGDMFIMVTEANQSLRNCDPNASYQNPPALGCCYADANGNGKIDGGDMGILVYESNAGRRNCPIVPHCPNVP